jgi:hypothetical protein
MNDIRPDILERLEVIAADSARLRTRLTRNDAEEQMLKQLLRREEERFGRLEASLVVPSKRIDGGRSKVATTPLAKLIVSTISQADRPVTMDDLKRAAEEVHFDFGAKKPGRVLHWALVAMRENDVIEKNGEGWRLKTDSAAAETA